jgi:hypothetical protein
MLTLLKIEHIGNPRQGFSPAGVEEIVGLNDEGMIKRRLKGQLDYSKANSVGSRGVFEYFFLQEGAMYHVSAPQTWKRTDQYFCRIESGKIMRMGIEEAFECLLRGR